MEKNNNIPQKNWISFRVKPEEYKQIHRHFTSTTCRKLSEYARKVLLNKPVVVRYRNQSADEFLSAMIPLKKELNAAGNNFNQAVKKLHPLSQLQEFRTWIINYECEKNRLLQQIDEIKFQMQKMYEKWSQE